LKSREHAIEVTNNNISGTLNMLYAIKEYDPECHLIQIGSMGEYNPAMGIPIPEGKFDMTYKGKIIKNVIFPREPGSFYHASKVASTYYIDCACKWWGLRATDIMQGVVYGNWTFEIEKTGINSPLWSDEAFGTVVNRFIVQTIIGIEWDVMYIESPRAESTSWFEYNPIVDKLKNLGFSHTRELKEESKWVMNELLKVKDSLYPLAEGVVPKITWK